jgi:hypothetical protein
MTSQLAEQPAERMPLLIAERNQKMAVSAHAYVRGNTAKFYERDGCDWLFCIGR